MIDIEMETKELEEGQTGKEEPEEDLKPADMEGLFSILYYF